MLKITTDKKKITEILERGVIDQVLPSKQEFVSALQKGKRLRFYIGFDATAPSLHLGHAQNILLLEDFRSLGHEVIFLIGDFTARIGDPSGKSTARSALTTTQIKSHIKNWQKEIKPLINFSGTNPARVLFNSKWLSKLTLSDVTDLATNFTVQQMLERDMFEKRWKAETPIYLSEFLYPLMQGYDSVAMDIDVELCGTDQIFNALAGRTLQKRLKNKDKFVVAAGLLSNPKTGQLMSKSQGTGIFLNLSPSDLYGAVMAQPDEMVEPLLVRCTRLPLAEIKKITHFGPRAAKGKTALAITELLHGKKAATDAEKKFLSTFRDKQTPTDIVTIRVSEKIKIADALVAKKLLPSKSQWQRLVKDGAVKTESGEKITDINFAPKPGTILKIGKRLFVKIS